MFSKVCSTMYIKCSSDFVVWVGHLGKFTLSLHWMNLGNQPVEILIEDVYLLVVPSPQTDVNLEEEEERAQATKAERVENAELLHMQGQVEMQDRMPISPLLLTICHSELLLEDSQQSQGLWASLTAKIINNLQVTVKNIHIRYEDKLSVPGVGSYSPNNSTTSLYGLFSTRLQRV